MRKEFDLIQTTTVLVRKNAALVLVEQSACPCDPAHVMFPV